MRSFSREGVCLYGAVRGQLDVLVGATTALLLHTGRNHPTFTIVSLCEYFQDG